MFGAWRKAKAITAAKTLLQQTLAPLTTLGRTIPSSIYKDPFVLGYLNAISAFASEAASKGRLSTEDRGRVAVEALRAVAGMNVRAAVESTIRFSSDGNAEFQEGSRQANRMINVMYGLLRPEQDQEIAQAFQSASDLGVLGHGTIETKAAAMLGLIHFHQYVDTHHRKDDE